MPTGGALHRWALPTVLSSLRGPILSTRTPADGGRSRTATSRRSVAPGWPSHARSRTPLGPPSPAATAEASSSGRRSRMRIRAGRARLRDRCRRSAGTSQRPHQKIRSSRTPESSKASPNVSGRYRRRCPWISSNSLNSSGSAGTLMMRTPPGFTRVPQLPHGLMVVVDVLDHVQGEDRVVCRAVVAERLSQVGFDQGATRPVELLEGPARDIHAGDV